MFKWLTEWLTRRWEIPDQFNSAAYNRNSPPIWNRIKIVVFSIGLNAEGEPTFANQLLVDWAAKLCWLCRRFYWPGIPCEVVFCTGENQPVGISSASAMQKYAIQRQSPEWLPPELIQLDEASWDTPSNAKEAARIIEGTTIYPDDHAHIGVILVCHPLHMRRSLMCLSRALKRRENAFKTYKVTYQLVASSPGYALLHDQRLYERTPGQFWLNSHVLYLFYEMLVYLPTLLLQGKSKRASKLVRRVTHTHPNN